MAKAPAKKSAAKKAPAKASAKPAKAATGASTDWRAEMLGRIRRLIKEADPAITETVKWRKPSNPNGVPVWERDGIICTGETYKAHVKTTFMRGGAVKDPAGLFNSGEGVRRAIDLKEGDTLNEAAFKALVKTAVALNVAAKK